MCLSMMETTTTPFFHLTPKLASHQFEPLHKLLGRIIKILLDEFIKFILIIHNLVVPIPCSDTTVMSLFWKFGENYKLGKFKLD